MINTTIYTGVVNNDTWTGHTSKSENNIDVFCIADNGDAHIVVDGKFIMNIPNKSSGKFESMNVGYDSDYTIFATAGNNYCTINQYNSSKTVEFFQNDFPFVFLMAAYVLIFIIGLRKGLRK